MNKLASQSYKHSILALIALVLMSTPLIYDYFVFQPSVTDMQGSDIFAIWTDGKKIEAGINPYSKIHGSDMRQNEKFTTYLPGFFWLEVLAVKANGRRNLFFIL